MEDKFMAPFFVKQRVSIEKGDGIHVWDEEGNRYIDFTSGWGVTCIGHGQKVIREALYEQAGKIIQNPNSGLTYSLSLDGHSLRFNILKENPFTFDMAQQCLIP